MKPPIPTEHQEQAQLVEYLELLQLQGKVRIFSAVNNNLNTGNFVQLHKRKVEGVRSGVPDLIVVTKHHLLFIELKKVKGGVVSPAQKEWLQVLSHKKVVTNLAHGFDEARTFIDQIVVSELPEYNEMMEA